VKPKAASKITVEIGGTEYLVDGVAIPYFGRLANTNDRSMTTSRIQHADIPYFGIIIHAVQNGSRHFFLRMPHQLAEYRILCKTLDFLSVDVVKHQKLQDIARDLKTGNDDYDPEERMVIKVSKRGPRDAAFRLLYLFLADEVETQGSVAYNAVLYVVSHRRVFKYRTRKLVREAFEDRFVVTYKQRVGLDKWPVTEPDYTGWQTDEGTTEEEDTGYDSDYGLDYDWSD
jgi:hypothetical protein